MWGFKAKQKHKSVFIHVAVPYLLNILVALALIECGSSFGKDTNGRDAWDKILQLEEHLTLPQVCINLLSQGLIMSLPLHTKPQAMAIHVREDNLQ